MNQEVNQIVNPFYQIDLRLESIEKTLFNLTSQLTENSNKNTTDNSLINIEAAAEFIQLSTATIYKLVSENNIPVIKKRRRLLFDKQELSKWLLTGKKLTLSEIQKKSSKK